MAGTYSKIYIQVVFAVKGRQNLIPKSYSDQLYKYICGIINNKGHKCIIVNGMPDHIHVFIGMKPSMALSDLVRDIKNNSSKFINSQEWMKEKFSWQEGFGAFSYSESQIKNVYRYIENQEAHHSKKSFKDEYTLLLKQYNIEHKEEYLFDWID